ncbi:MAG: ABC transporter permease [Pirellulaceae bacterium]|nr:ABC transporter permease [Pirellulaceae bacterium]MDG2470122.1 ABC transporter permease [Pirellulaceae bacterium]
MKPIEEIVYTPEPPLYHPGGLLKKIFSENWDRRELCGRLFIRNISVQYRQTLLGLTWLFLPAIASSMVWLFLQSFRVIQFKGDYTSGQYLLFVLIGMVLWQSFFEAVTKPLAAFQQNRTMLLKINFPREVVIVVSAMEVVFNGLVRSVVIIPFLVYLQQDVAWTLAMLFFPLALIALIITGLAIGICLMPVGALYQDVGRTLIIISPIWMILTPVIYPVPTGFPANLLIYCNPASPMLITGRELIMGGELIYLSFAMLSLLGVLPLLVFSLILYRISIPILLERVGAS